MATDNNTNLQPFELTLDLTDLSIDRPQGGGRRWNTMPEGRYKVRINECGVYTSKAGTNSVRFTVEIIEGDHAGALTDVYCGLKIDEVGTRLGWKRALASIGVPMDVMEDKNFAVNAGMFKDQDAYVEVSVNRKNPTNDKGEPNYNRNFITSADYEQAPGAAVAERQVNSAGPVAVQAPTAAAGKWTAKAPVAAPAAPAVTMSVPKPKAGAAAMYGSMIGKQ